MKQDSLRQNFSSFQQLTSDLIEKYLNSSNVSFVKFLLKSYFIFLSEQNFEEWENSITQTSYGNLLVLIVHSKSRIRKVAKDCVLQLFNKLDHEVTENLADHPIYKITTEFTKSRIKETSGEDISDGN
jgi:hypothetical protein